MVKAMKKILFIIPPYFNIDTFSTNNIASRRPVFTIPYGVFSIAAYVKAYSKYDVRVKIIDLNAEAYKICTSERDFIEEAGKLIEKDMHDFTPDFVGISALFNTCFTYLDFISTIVRNADKNALLVCGGGLPTNLYSEVLNRCGAIDAVCFGEGEIPICELMDATDPKEYVKSHAAWITRECVRNKRIPQSAFVQNLDDIPMFDYSSIDFDTYCGRAVDKRYNQKKFRELSIHTSRGCPFNCVFCSNGKLHGKKVRFMSVEKVVDEVERMVNLYKIEVLLIEDDHFLADKERAKKILKKLIKFNMRIEFPNGIAVYAIDDEISELLKKAGTTTISLAVESGSDFVLKNIIHKPLRVALIKGAVERLRKNDICIHAFFVIGLPGELEEHRAETMRMIFDVGFDWVQFFIAIPIAGSKLYDICKEKGYLINDDFSEHNSMKCNIRTPENDPEYIEEKAYLMNLEANFVRNYNLSKGKYERAFLYFKNVTDRYPNHALAHYYLAESYKGIGTDNEAMEYHRNRFQNIIMEDPTWEEYARQFNITVQG